MSNPLIIELRGGLDNQLFHYAFGTLISLKIQKNVVFDASRYCTKNGMGARNIEIHKFYNDIKILYSSYRLLQKLGIFFPLVCWSMAINNFRYDNNKRHNICFSKKHSKILFVPHIFFDNFNEMCESLDNVIYIAKERFWGYEIFAPIKTLLQQTIHFQSPLDSHNVVALQKIKNTKESVAVHIRRGDFLQSNYPINLSETQYYTNALQIMRKNYIIQHFLFSVMTRHS